MTCWWCLGPQSTQNRAFPLYFPQEQGNRCGLNPPWGYLLALIIRHLQRPGNGVT